MIFVLLLAASLFLIVNTIRLATFARRREIEVMKLVGASNWFVRIPFMLEGLVQGVIGAAFAFGAVYGLKEVVTNAISRNSDFSRGFYLGNSDAITIGIYVLLLGAGDRCHRLDRRPPPVPRGLTRRTRRSRTSGELTCRAAGHPAQVRLLGLPALGELLLRRVVGDRRRR